MLADTAAIHRFGTAQDRHAAELEAIAARLAGVSATLTSDALGPVGARFLAALREAVDRDAHTATALCGHVAGCAERARGTAAEYSTTELAAGRRVGTVGL